ncbi:protein of unknown function [Xenorhabdus poinarii G6]|uniref:Uncharacterized protein n=1 Tax=Xenorhabdus poinarii G6 TaxID=1354304 RepID=A0A068RAS8_9GAMM|nr:protein of unknown function [Xenorhabdus poinarii G6]
MSCVYSHLEKVAYARLKVGMFILATNEMDDKVLNMETLLANYKAQQKSRAGFPFSEKSGVSDLSDLFEKARTYRSVINDNDMQFNGLCRTGA